MTSWCEALSGMRLPRVAEGWNMMSGKFSRNRGIVDNITRLNINFLDPCKNVYWILC